MDSTELRDRTKRLSLNIIELFKRMPRTFEGQVLGKQVLRSATSVAANYRAACRARSRAEFITKISIVVEEADETVFWLELIGESKVAIIEAQMLREASEILAIMAASRKTAGKTVMKTKGNAKALNH